MCSLVAEFDVKTVKDIAPEAFIAAFAKHLKAQGKIDIPQWSEYVKTGTSRELAPYDADWMYTRAASIMRKLYLRPNMGVGAFRKVYGQQGRRGTCTNHFALGAGKLNRFLLQQLQKIGLVEMSQSVKGGRRVTSTGQQECDQVAVQIAQARKEAQ